MKAEEIREHAEELDSLFKQVLDNSSFTFGVLEIDAYARWKELLGDKLIFQSVTCDEKLVGFLSAFNCGKEFEVHYVGLEYECNKELGLYQRMLVEFLKKAIEGGYERINYGKDCRASEEHARCCTGGDETLYQAS